MSPRQREALLRDGLWGVLETRADNGETGIWRYYHSELQERDLSRVHFQGVLPARDVFAFADFIRASWGRDRWARPTESIWSAAEPLRRTAVLLIMK